MRSTIHHFALLLPLCLSACADPEIATVAYQRQRIEDVTFRAVFDAAERAVAKDFQIASRDVETGRVVGVDLDAPFESQDLRPLGDTLGTQPRARRRAEVQVREQDGGVEVHCQVHVQENATDTVRLANRERGVDDLHHETPVDRDAGTTVAQNTVWRNRRRDRGAEQAILATIRDSVGGRVVQPNGS